MVPLIGAARADGLLPAGQALTCFDHLLLADGSRTDAALDAHTVGEYAIATACMRRIDYVRRSGRATYA